MAGLPNAELFVEWKTGVPMALADTNRSTFMPSGTSAAPGLVPTPPLVAGAVLFLREDGTWATPSVTALATISSATFIGRPVGSGDGPPQAMTASEATAILNIFVSSSAGKKGLVPAPTTSDIGKVLGVNGWETPATAASGLTLLTGASIASSTSVVNINFSSFTGYSEIYVQLYGLRSNTSAGDAILCQFSSNGTTYTSVSYEWSLALQQAAVNVSNAASDTSILLTGRTNSMGSTTGKGYNGRLSLVGPFQASIRPIMNIQALYSNNSATPNMLVVNGGAVYYTTMTVMGIALFCSVSTFAGGRYEVFGYASS